MKLILFDIDGTLLKTGGAGRDAMNAAFEGLHGVRDAFEGIDMGGRLDPSLYAEACGRHGVRAPLDGFWPAYVRRLRVELGRPGREGLVLPGVLPLLERLSLEPRAKVGILTGNQREGASAKLEHFGLSGYFPFGAYGDDAGDREALVPVAAERARERTGILARGREIVIVGDTVRDIECAAANRAVSVAVASGWTSYEALRAHGPDRCLRDLTDTEASLNALLGDG